MRISGKCFQTIFSITPFNTVIVSLFEPPGTMSPEFLLPVIIKSMTNTCGCVMFSGWTVGVVKGVEK